MRRALIRRDVAAHVPRSCVGPGRDNSKPQQSGMPPMAQRCEHDSRNRAVARPGKETLQALYEKGGLIRLAFPYYRDLPALFAKRDYVLTVASDVAGELRGPVLLPRLRHVGTSAADVLVPEASVHKHNPTQLGKDQVGCSRKIAAVQPETKPQPVRGAAHRDLRRCIFSFDQRHDCATLLRTNRVHSGLGPIYWVASLTAPLLLA